jgi:bifunctional non-homologous end joining protein LigD
MGLTTYRRKRNFERSPEPRGGRAARSRALSFVIQKHAATRLHYDFRLELDGVLKSWAVPKGPSLDPGDKRLAMEVEDHPIEYGGFEGTIPKGEYGGGSVLLWDRGDWVPIGDPRQGLSRGRLEFELVGEKLRGRWVLVRIRREGEKNAWLLIKHRDAEARAGAKADIVTARPESVQSGRSIEEIGKGASRVWHSNRDAAKTSVRARRAAARRAPEGRREPSGDVASLRASAAKASGARRGALPRVLAPELATLVDEAPDGDGWLHEIKYDGFRILARIERGRARLSTRTNQDWTERFEPIAAALSRLPVERALLDGELVVLEPDGTTSFQALQNALRTDRDAELVYFAFDLLHLDGVDLARTPLEQRKRLLERLLALDASGGTLRYSAHIQGQGPAFFEQACARRLEGIISKRRDAAYVSGRARDWLKVKCTARQEFVIGGFTEPSGSREDLGSLLLGVAPAGARGRASASRGAKARLRYAGRVGTGFTRESLRELRRRLAAIEIDAPPFESPPRVRGVHWVKPTLVAEVSFTEMTRDGRLRHPSFEGLREDKPSRQVVLERPAAIDAVTPRRGGNRRTRSTRTARASETPIREPDSEPPARDPGPRKPPIRDPEPKTPGQDPPPDRSPVREPGRKVPDRDPPAKKPPVVEPPKNPTAVQGVRISHPTKVMYPSGITKLEVASFVDAASEAMLPHVIGRPLMLLRCPNGIAQCFHQKHPVASFPDGLGSVAVTERGGTRPYWVVEEARGLVELIQMGVLEIHLWGARGDRLEQPDRVVFDLDPDPSVAWPRVVEAAHRLRESLARFDLQSFVKTTGGKGLHVIAPIRRGPGWDVIRDFSSALAMELVREEPQGFTTHMSKARRPGRILIDTVRNRRGSTWVAPFSPRARPTAGYSAPLRWSELTKAIDPGAFNLADHRATLPARRRAWQGFERVRQTITLAMIRDLRRSA